MRTIPTLVAIAGLAAAAYVEGAESPACTSSGDLNFVCGIQGPEDIVAVPGTPWLIAGSMTPGGGLHLINATTKKKQVIYPAASATPQPDERYKRCPGALDPKQFIAHGLHVATGEKNSTATLYVVNHGGRQSVEVFGVDASDAAVSLHWKGCIEMPTGYEANSVTAFRDGTVLATVFNLPGKSLDDVFQGRNSGAVYRWRPGEATFSLLPGTELSGNNGIETSKDEREFYVAATGSRKVHVFSRSEPVKLVREIPLPGFLPDNIHWGSDGRLILAGTVESEPSCPKVSDPAEQVKMMMSCPHGFIAAAIDATTMNVVVLAREPANKAFSNVSTGILVNKELWYSSWSTDRVAYRTIPKSP